MISVVVALAALAVGAQQRIPCDRGLVSDGVRSKTRGTRSVSALTGQFRVPVILAAYPDQRFLLSDASTLARWDAMLNQKGYAENGVSGCVADYFRDQSQGQLELTFDVMGPVLLPDSMAYYGANRYGEEGDDIRPEVMIRDACVATGKDFSPYDWNGDGTVDVVMVVYAGQSENQGGGENAIWPHKYVASGYKVGNLSLYDYACVSDLRHNSELDGFGTFCHEFSHNLGLPDLYPVSGSAYSIFDEWDLMDGGNYAYNGWGIPNYSAFERHLCGWLNLTELASPASITDMPSMSEEAGAYVIYNDAHRQEYFILENRQQQGWDYFVPGNGLLVTHVCDYTSGDMSPNNSSRTRVELLPADNRSYRESEAFFGEPKYKDDGRNKFLSLAAYPYILGDIVNDRITNVSEPAFTLKHADSNGSLYLSKPVTNIRFDAEGHVSFDFMMEPDPDPTAIAGVRSLSPARVEAYYDLNGRRLPATPQAPGIYIIRYSNGKTQKMII